MPQKVRSIAWSPGLLFEAAATGAILLAGWLYTSGIERSLDIRLYDESNYLHWGASIPTEGLSVARSAPLYEAWYCLLSFFESDRVGLYYLNYRAMTVLPCVAIFLFLRSHRVQRAIALAVSLLFLLSAGNFPVWPKVGHFALAVVLCGLALASRARTHTSSSLALAVTAFATSYARPELFLGFILLALVSVAVVVREYRQRPASSRWLAPILAGLAVAALTFVWGAPIGSGNRSMTAFGQHYSLNWVEWHGAGMNPWTNWETIVKRDFGEVTSPAQAMASNPAAFLRHVTTNVKRLPTQIGATFLHFHPSLGPHGRATVAVALLLALVVLLGATPARAVRLARTIRRNAQRLWLFLASAVLLSVPSAIACVAIWPRQHYLLGFCPIWGCLVAIVFFGRPADGVAASGRRAANLGGLLLLLAFLAAFRPVASAHSEQPELKTIRFLRSIEVAGPVNILEAEGGYDIYIGRHFKRVAEYDKGASFFSFLRQHSVNMIVLSDLLRRDARFSTDPEWLEFIRSPSAYGFVRLPVPGVPGRAIIVRRELIPGGSASAAR